MYLTALAAFAVFAAPAAADADRPICDGGVLTARPGAPLTTEFPRCEGAGENPTITATPSIGTVTGVPFVYTPPAGFVGVDHFTYTVTNTATNETSLPATVSVVVNTPATCADAELTTPLDTPLRIPWKAFPCTDPDGQSLLIHADDNAANGDVDDDFGTGTVTYTPNPGFTGTDEFTFHASDGVRDTPERTITVKVTPPVQADPSPTPAATVSPTPTPAGGGGAPAADTTAPSVAVNRQGDARPRRDPDADQRRGGDDQGDADRRQGDGAQVQARQEGERPGDGRDRDGHGVREDHDQALGEGPPGVQ